MKLDIFIACEDGKMIRPVVPADVSSEYIETLNCPITTQYMGNAKSNHHTFESVQAYVQENLDSSADLLLGIFKDNDLWGTSRLHNIEVNEKTIWQGVLVFVPYQRKGLGLQIVKKVSDFALNDFGISKIFAGILENNIASQRVFHNAGFVHFDNDLDYSGRQIWIKYKC